MAIHSLEVVGYRSIRKLNLEPEQLTVIVGANGTGKTNLYRSLVLLQAAAQGTFARLLAEEGGIRSVVWAGPRKKEPVRTGLSVAIDDLSLELLFGPVPKVPGEPGYFALDPEMKEERAWVQDGKKKHLILERTDRTAFLRDADGNRATFPASLSPSESVISQLAEPHKFPLLSAIRSELLSWRFYHHFPTGPDAPSRHPQVATRTPVLSGDGRDLAAALATILVIGDWQGMCAAVDAAFPGSKLEIPDESRLRVLLHQPGLMRPMEPQEFSDGTLRYLCLLAALKSPRPPPLLVLNEPETSLHPNLIEPLADEIVRASRDSQVIVTTHDVRLSARIAKAKRVREVHLQRKDGETVVTDDSA